MFCPATLVATEGRAERRPSQVSTISNGSMQAGQGLQAQAAKVRILPRYLISEVLNESAFSLA